MPVTYTEADEMVAELLAEVMAAERPELFDAGVSVQVVMAESDDGEPALVAKKVPVLADIRLVSDMWQTVVSGQQRVALGAPILRQECGRETIGRVIGTTHACDAVLRIDLRRWSDLPDEERKSLLHHEIMHLELKKWGRDQEKCLWFDRKDNGRPKLRLRPGDLNPCDGFRAVIRRFGTSAHEWKAWTEASREARIESGELLRELAARIVAGGGDDDDDSPEE